jgi:hypothetical protein
VLVETAMNRWPPVRYLIALVIALLVTAGCVNWFLLRPHNDFPARGDAALPLPAVRGPAILKLELAWRDEDVTQILAPAADPEAIRRTIADARAGNWADTWLYVPSYSLLLITLGALGAAAGRSNRWLTAIVIGAVIVAVGDWLENLGISRALDHPESGGIRPGDARAISNPALVKWIMLPVVLGLISTQLFTARRWWTVALGTVSLALALYITFALSAYARERTVGTAETARGRVALPAFRDVPG